MSIQKSHDIVEDRNINIIHSPLLPEEKSRIEKCNGTVSEHNIAPYLPFVARVFANKECTRGGLAMSRSIGDQLIHRYGVISDPTNETVVFSRAKYAGYRVLLLFGSDGFLSYLDRDRLIHDYFVDVPLEQSLPTALQSAHDHLLQQTQHKYADDASGIALSIQFSSLCCTPLLCQSVITVPQLQSVHDYFQTPISGCPFFCCTL